MAPIDDLLTGIDEFDDTFPTGDLEELPELPELPECLTDCSDLND